MRAKNLVEVSPSQQSMRSQDSSPEIFTREVHHQYPTRNNQVMMIKQPHSWYSTPSFENSIKSVPARGRQNTKMIHRPKNTNYIKVLMIILGVLFAAIALTGMILGIYAAVNIQQTKTSNVTTITTTTTSTVTSTTTSTTTSTSTSTSTTTAAILPAQCFSYTVYADATRHVTAAGGSGCDLLIFTSTATWVRFLGPGGNDIPTSAPSTSRCGTNYPGWYTGVLPATGSTVVGTVCYASSTTNCLYNNLITVTNCGSFYIYGLIDGPACNSRYCTV